MKRDDSQHNTAATGRAIRERAQGKAAPALEKLLGELDPDLPAWSDEFIFGTVWNRPGLEYDERMLIAIASLASQGHIDQLRNYLHGALQDGIAPERVQETLLMTCVYAGFPTALSALYCWLEVKRSHERQAD